MLFSAKPVRVWHLLHSVIFAAVYLITTVIYQSASGIKVYPVLDWANPGKAIALSFPLLFIGVPAVHLFMFLLYKVRVIIHAKCTGKVTKATPVHKTESTQSVVSHVSLIDDLDRYQSNITPTCRNGTLTRKDTQLSVNKFRLSFRQERRISVEVESPG